MSYYYDVILNFNMDELWKFYEWEDSDELTFIRKMPLFRVSFETICDFMKYHIIVEKEFLKSIEGKTITKNHGEEIYASFLMSDSKNALAVQLNEKGEVIALSQMLLEDENNLNEFIYTVKEKEISYERKAKRKQVMGLRQERKRRMFIQVELNTLESEKNIQKLKYLYYEWFNEESDDISKMIQKMNRSLEKDNDNMIEHIYYLIRLSYHQV